MVTWIRFRDPTDGGGEFHMPGVTAHRAAINTFSDAGQFPSGHLPVQAFLSLG